MRFVRSLAVGAVAIAMIAVVPVLASGESIRPSLITQQLHVEPLADGGETATLAAADGYEVSLSRAEIVLATTEPVVCDHSHGWWPFAATAAFAGHGADSLLQVEPRVTVDLLAGEDVELGTVILEEPALCGLHHAIGATPGDAEGRSSLLVSGTWTDGVTSGVIEIDSSLAWGGVVDLLADGTVVHVAADGTASTLTLQLSLTEAMTLVNPASGDVAIDLLRALTDTATATAQGSVHG